MRQCSKRGCTLAAKRGFRFCNGSRCSEIIQRAQALQKLVDEEKASLKEEE